MTFSNGETVVTDIVIGADGIDSALQRGIGLKTYPSSGEILSWAKDIGGGMSMWIGKGRGFLCYAVSGGRLQTRQYPHFTTRLRLDRGQTHPPISEAGPSGFEEHRQASRDIFDRWNRRIGRTANHQPS